MRKKSRWIARSAIAGASALSLVGMNGLLGRIDARETQASEWPEDGPLPIIEAFTPTPVPAPPTETATSVPTATPAVALAPISNPRPAQPQQPGVAASPTATEAPSEAIPAVTVPAQPTTAASTPTVALPPTSTPVPPTPIPTATTVVRMTPAATHARSRAS